MANLCFFLPTPKGTLQADSMQDTIPEQNVK